jgi:hypothetical protein
MSKGMDRDWATMACFAIAGFVFGAFGFRAMFHPDTAVLARIFCPGCLLEFQVLIWLVEVLGFWWGFLISWVAIAFANAAIYFSVGAIWVGLRARFSKGPEEPGQNSPKSPLTYH